MIESPLTVSPDYPTAITGQLLDDHLDRLPMLLMQGLLRRITTGVRYEICMGEITSSPSPSEPGCTRHEISMTIQEKP